MLAKLVPGDVEVADRRSEEQHAVSPHRVHLSGHHPKAPQVLLKGAGQGKGAPVVTTEEGGSRRRGEGLEGGTDGGGLGNTAVD